MSKILFPATELVNRQGQTNNIPLSKLYNSANVEKVREVNGRTVIIFKEDRFGKEQVTVSESYNTIKGLTEGGFADFLIPLNVTDADSGVKDNYPYPASFLASSIREAYVDSNSDTNLRVETTPKRAKDLIYKVSEDLATILLLADVSSDDNGIYTGSGALQSGATVATLPTGASFALAGDFGTIFSLDGDSGLATFNGLVDLLGSQYQSTASNPGNTQTVWFKTGGSRPQFGDSEELALLSDVQASDTLSEILGNGNTTGANNISINTGQSIVYNNNSFTATINEPTLAGNIILTLPALTGTIALTSDIPAPSGDGMYDGSGTIPSSTVATITDKLSFNDDVAGSVVTIGNTPAGGLIDIEIADGSLSPLSVYENAGVATPASIGDNYSMNWYANDSAGAKTLGATITTRISAAPTSGDVNMDLQFNNMLKAQYNGRVLIKENGLTSGAIAVFHVEGIVGSTNGLIYGKSHSNTASQSLIVLVNSDNNGGILINGQCKTVFNNNQIATGDVQMKGDIDANLFYADASTDRVGIGIAAPAYKLDVLGDVNVSGAFIVATNQVVGARKTGWDTATGTATRTTFDTGTVTTAQLAERVKALIDDLDSGAGHGLIGA